MSRWLSLAVLAISSFGLHSTAVAQDDAMVEVYGQGLHRYYAGDYQEAERLLSLVVDSGSQDPRAHFFRGLAQFMQGNSDSAKYDFENGALAEARGKRVVAVGTALQRIQGPVRREIEKARQAARVTVLVEQAQLRRMREDTARAQAATMPAPMMTQPTVPQPMPSVSSNATDPFAGNSGMQAGKPSVEGAKPTAPTGDAANNPFADDPAQPAAPSAMPEPAAADPFGTTPAPSTPAPASSDPFSVPSTPTAPAAGEGTAPAAGDPFAPTPAAPAAPAAAGTDPFSGT